MPMTRDTFASDLLNLLPQAAGLQAIVDFGSVGTGNPILLCDSRFRILYMSHEEGLHIELWERAAQEGYISDAVLMDIHM